MMHGRLVERCYGDQKSVRDRATQPDNPDASRSVVRGVSVPRLVYLIYRNYRRRNLTEISAKNNQTYHYPAAASALKSSVNLVSVNL